MFIKSLGLIISCCLFISFLVGCNSASQVKKSNTILKAENVILVFKNSGVPIENIKIYTVETDPNKLLGRPGQYMEKINWNDNRVKDANGTVEIFKSQEELENRKAYIEKNHKNFPNLTQYIYAHKNALIRLDHDFTPMQADEYKKLLEQL